MSDLEIITPSMHSRHSRVSRRGFLRVVLATGGGLAGLAAVSCAPGAPAPTPTTQAPRAAIPTPAPMALTTPTTPPAPTAAATRAAQPTAAAATVAPAVTAATVPAAAATQTPVMGGKVIATIRQEFTDLDPIHAIDYATWTAMNSVYSGLYNIAQDFQIYPQLAESMPKITDNGTTYTVKLRKGVKFHHGRELTSDDVVYTFNRTAHPKNASWGQGYLVGIDGFDELKNEKADTLKGVKAIDPYTVEIRLKQPRAVFIQELTMSTIHVVPKDETERLGKKMSQQAVGSGAFKFKEWVSGQRLVLVKNKDYFLGPRPYLDEVEYQIGVETQVGLLRLLRGEVDYVFEPPPAAEMASIINDEKYKDYRIIRPDPANSGLGINVQMKPFDKLEVRQAVGHALHIQKYIDSLGGAAFRLNGYIPVGLPGHNSDLKPIAPYDPAKAKELLQKGGQGSGFKTELWWGVGNTVFDTLMPMIQQDLKQLGVDAELKRVENKALREASRKNPGVPLSPVGWGPDYPDPSDWYTVNFGCENVKDGGTNVMKYCNAKMDELRAEAEKQYKDEDQKKRLQMYMDVEKMMLADFPYIPLYQLNLVRVRSPRFKGFQLHPIWRENWEDAWTLPK